ncbi:hypothetical protein [Georgenia wangjunii]|uniref:hypothetical protein n=1 Tax=Georgenia wangjunii TaxID=3117730 RepID=UPI002F264C92
MTRTARRPLAAAVLGAAALVTTGCALGTPVQTLEPYSASDGIRVEVTELVRGENLMILTEEQGAEGVLLGALVNDTTEDVEFSLIVADERVSVRVPARERVALGVDDDVELAAVPDAPGSVTQATISTATHGAVTAPVPVLDGTLSGYAEFVP